MKIKEKMLMDVHSFIVHYIKYKVVLPRHIFLSKELTSLMLNILNLFFCCLFLSLKPCITG